MRQETVPKSVFRKQQKLTRLGIRTDLIAERLNEAFGPPFLPTGYVEAQTRVGKDGYPFLAVRIGDRDVEVDYASGAFIGSGSNMGEAKEWGLPERKNT